VSQAEPPAKGGPARALAKAPAKVSRQPGAPPWWRTLRADAPFALRIAIGAGFVAFVIFVWWLVTRGGPTEAMISPSKLPGPGKVFGSLSALVERGLNDALLSTLRRVLLGIGVAAIVGIGLGVVAASFRGVAAAVGPIVIFLRSVPMGALLPLTLVWFSTDEKQKWMFIFLAVVPFVFSDTVKAISTVPERYVETAETLGASRVQIIRKVLFPLALPDIITSLRFQFGLALGYITLAEAINTERGIGAMLNMGEKRGLIEQNLLLLFLIATLAFAIDWGIRGFQRGVFPYRKDL